MIRAPNGTVHPVADTHTHITAKLISPKTPFKWTDDAEQKAFEEIKNHRVSSDRIPARCPSQHGRVLPPSELFRTSIDIFIYPPKAHLLGTFNLSEQGPSTSSTMSGMNPIGCLLRQRKDSSNASRLQMVPPGAAHISHQNHPNAGHHSSLPNLFYTKLTI